MKALNVEEQSVQETEQEERVRPVQPRRKQRQLNQKVRYEQSVAEEAVVAPVVEETVAAEPIVQEAAAPRTELVKVPLPVVAQTAPEQQEENNADNRDNGGMPRRSRRSPRHLRVSGQRRRRYRDERYPTQSPMPLTVACASRNWPLAKSGSAIQLYVRKMYRSKSSANRKKYKCSRW